MRRAGFVHSALHGRCHSTARWPRSVPLSSFPPVQLLAPCASAVKPSALPLGRCGANLLSSQVSAEVPGALTRVQAARRGAGRPSRGCVCDPTPATRSGTAATCRLVPVTASRRSHGYAPPPQDKGADIGRAAAPAAPARCLPGVDNGVCLQWAALEREVRVAPRARPVVAACRPLHAALVSSSFRSSSVRLHGRACCVWLWPRFDCTHPRLCSLLSTAGLPEYPSHLHTPPPPPPAGAGWQRCAAPSTPSSAPAPSPTAPWCSTSTPSAGASWSRSARRRRGARRWRRWPAWRARPPTWRCATSWTRCAAWGWTPCWRRWRHTCRCRQGGGAGEGSLLVAAGALGDGELAMVLASGLSTIEELARCQL